MKGEIKIPVSRPYIGRACIEAVKGPIESGWLSQGPVAEAFEKEFARYAGARHAVAVSSCTAALHLALLTIGVGGGDEVILPSFSFVATAAAVEYTGAKPVFCDVLPGTYNIDPDKIEEKITRRTRAILPVHYFGLCADMKRVMSIARSRGLSVVEDAACAVGSRIGEKHAGTFGAAGCFSFHPRKIITTGEGGMLLTGNKAAAASAASLRTHGASSQAFSRHKSGGCLLPDFDSLGYNYRMTDMQAALGISQLAMLDDIVSMRRKHAATYRSLLGKYDWLSLPDEPEGFLHTYQSFVVVLDKAVNRDETGARLERGGIATRQGSHAIHMLGYYRKKYGLKASALPVSRMLHERSLALPLYPQMTVREIKTVVEALASVVS